METILKRLSENHLFLSYPNLSTVLFVLTFFHLDYLAYGRSIREIIDALSKEQRDREAI